MKKATKPKPKPNPIPKPKPKPNPIPKNEAGTIGSTKDGSAIQCSPNETA